MGDLNTEAERRLGALVKAKYHTDFFILTRYPLAVSTLYRPFERTSARTSELLDMTFQS